MAGVVRAAGGVVWRRGPGGIEVALVHRPRYDDWTFPKGKSDPGETDEQTAVREVEEETGLRCRLGADLGRIEYRDGRGRPKVVRYWAMTVEAAAPRPPDDEVDATCWLPVDDARVTLTYARDRSVLDRLLNVLDVL